MPPRVLVLGAGVNGLACAVCVQQACPLAQVQIVAEHFTPDTTSDGTAGFWEPFYVGDGDLTLAKRVSEVTYKYMLALATSPLAGKVKVQKLSGYSLFKNRPTEDFFWKSIVHGFRDMTKEELEYYPLADSGTFHTAAAMDAPAYMEWLLERFKAQGGTTRQAKVDSIEEIAAECDILINCSGLSSRHLFKDEEVYPIKGQVWKVKAPWIKHFYILDEKDEPPVYILPGVDFVTVGGSGEADNWDTQFDPQLGARIWDKAVTFFPMLRHATPMKAWAGLRPARKSSFRLESDTINVHGRNVKVLHNYGHGGSGITMHWGCALEITKMVLESLGLEQNEAKKLVSRM